MVQVFPTAQKVGNKIKSVVRKVAIGDERADLRTAANSYACSLEGEMKRAGR